MNFLLTAWFSNRRLLLESRLAYLMVHPTRTDILGLGSQLSGATEVEVEELGSMGWLAEDPVYIKKFITGVTLKHLTRNNAFANGLVSVCSQFCRALSVFHFPSSTLLLKLFTLFEFVL
jgi:hypothetical protein